MPLLPLRAGLAAIAALASFSTTSLQAQERFAIPGDRVAIYNLAGDVRVERGTGADVVVEITRGGPDAADLKIDRAAAGKWRTLVVRYPDRTLLYPRMRWGSTTLGIDNDGRFGLSNLDPEQGTDRISAKAGERRDGRIRIMGRGRGTEAYADIRVLVPAGKAVAVHLGVGHMSVANVTSDLQLDVSSSSVNARGTQGFLRIDTGSGDVTLEGASGDVALNSGSGTVRALSVSNGVLKIDTGSGDVDAAGIDSREVSIATGSGSVTAVRVKARALRMETGSGDIKARTISASHFDMNAGSGSIHLDLLGDVEVGRVETGSGDVTITTSSNLGADVTLDTGSGSINVGVPITVMQRKESFLHGRIGDGRGTLKVGTGSGSIALR